MSSNYNVHLAILGPLNNLLLLSGRDESIEQSNIYRITCHSLLKSIVLLPCQNGSWRQISHLLTFLHSLEGSTNCHLSLAITHITTDQSIHNLGAHHITLHILDSLKLTICLLIWEGFLKLLLPYSIRSVDETVVLLTSSIEIHQFLGNNTNCMLNSGFGIGPLLSSQGIQLRLLAICTAVFLNGVQLIGWNIEISALGIRNLNIIFDNLVHLNLLKSLVDSKTMVHMNYIISHM